MGSLSLLQQIFPTQELNYIAGGFSTQLVREHRAERAIISEEALNCYEGLGEGNRVILDSI